MRLLKSRWLRRVVSEIVECGQSLIEELQFKEDMEAANNPSYRIELMDLERGMELPAQHFDGEEHESDSSQKQGRDSRSHGLGMIHSLKFRVICKTKGIRCLLRAQTYQTTIP